MMDSDRLLDADRRRIRFEARKLAVETFVKIHLEHLQGARMLLLNHLRLTFGLSLSAVAGLVTIYGAALRMGVELGSDPASVMRICFAVSAIVILVLSALLATRSVRKVAASIAHLTRQPFPNSDAEMAQIFEDSSADEVVIMENILKVMMLRIASEPSLTPATGVTTVLLIAGVLLGFAPFVIPG
jgi:hypothetical protein